MLLDEHAEKTVLEGFCIIEVQKTVRVSSFKSQSWQCCLSFGFLPVSHKSRSHQAWEELTQCCVSMCVDYKHRGGGGGGGGGG